ncbi:MAG: carbohydrate ABC transporter permease [Chloroflexota bacterium]
MADRTIVRPQERIRSKAPRTGIPRGQIATYAMLFVGAFVSILPFLWLVSWSLMTNVEVTVGRTIPEEVMWGNYTEAWDTANFSRFIWNSLSISTISIAGMLITCVPAAYAFSRMQFWGRNTLFAVMLATLMIPDVVTLIPNFLSVVWISRFSEAIFGEGGAWINNWPSLTFPFMASAFNIFLLRQFFAQIPEDYWDAARIDGANHLQFMLRVIVPLSRPAIMTVVLFAFIGSWNSLLWPLLVVNTDEWRPVAYGLTEFVQTDAGSALHLQMAASVIMIVPILLLYFVTQKQFTEGIASTGVKS